MRRIGIVGAGSEKFTPATEQQAKAQIRGLLCSERDVILVSGHSPMGGVDIWAEQIAVELGIPQMIFTPTVRQWNPTGEYGYKRRNLDIARQSDVVYVILPRVYPKMYTGQRFGECYHCHTTKHIKSGACWTAHKAMALGKPAYWITID
jgi:hypothetical protein